MTPWNDGYIADVSYDYSFFAELSPISMALNLLDQNIFPPDLTRFNYCELGCGQGFTTNILAAANPQGQFWGMDFNPTHVAEAQRLATAAQLDNIQFSDQSFAEFLDADTPPFDFITLHGVYAWVGDENRRTIVELLRQKLKFGGAVYISYNAMPGWSAIAPLRELMVQAASNSMDLSVQKVENGLNFAQELLDLKARYFLDNPSSQQELAEMREDSRNYLAHEYFNDDWRPLYHSEVVQQLAAAKLTFGSSADIDDAFYNLRLTDEQLDRLAKIPDRTLRETTRDFFFNTRFRRDIFVKGPVKLAPLEQAELLSQFRFVLLVLPEEIEYEIELVGKPIQLDPAIYQPLIAALSDRPQTLRELMQHPQLKQLGFATLWQALKILISIDCVAPALSAAADADRQTIVERLNAAVLKRSRFGADTPVLASPLTGSGVSIDRSEQLFLLAYLRNADPVQFISQVLQVQGERLTKDGEVLESLEANQAEISRQAERFLTERLPLFERFGLVRSRDR